MDYSLERTYPVSGVRLVEEQREKRRAKTKGRGVDEKAPSS